MSQDEQNLDELEDELRKKGYYIEKVEVKDGEVPQSCLTDDCFDDAEVFIEGSFYCSKHKEMVLKKLKEADEEMRREKERMRRETQERPKNWRR